MAPIQRMLPSIAFASTLFTLGYGEHHMKWKVERRQGASANIPLIVSNQCSETIHPAILTQAGTEPSESGFVLAPGANHTLHVSQDWQGRIWGRTNCTFNDAGESTGEGRQCSTGDCGPFLQCKGTGENPATLAEFTLSGANAQSYYDISLVDGYNLPMAIILLANSRSDVDDIPPNQTNPSCVGSIGDLGPANHDPYSNQQTFLGTNSSFPLPFNDASSSQVSQWCPWDLQVSPPQGPGDGVYPYPDSNVQRPAFNPCYSACAKYNEPAYCCTGKYDGPSKCSSNYYSKSAKAICPDAYSFAYDDQDSTFSVPEGAGFHVVLCPGGASTNILALSKGSDQVQHSNHAAAAKLNVFKHTMVLTEGMALKAVILGSLALAFLA